MTDITTIQGTCAPRFQAVRDELATNFQERGEVGASVCAIVDGEVVVDLHGGVADPATGRPWTADTVSVVWSSTKGALALCAHMLADRGQLDLGALVAARINNAVAQSEARPGQSEGRAVSDEELTLGRAFAPGLFADVSLGRSPVMAFVGAQLSPTLRDYFVCAGASCAAESQPTVRVLAGLSVDVPVFRMF